MSPALAGRPLTTEPREKPPRAVLRCVLSPVPRRQPDWWVGPGGVASEAVRLEAATPILSPSRRKSSVAGRPASRPFLASPPGAALSSPHATGCTSPCISRLWSSLQAPRPASVLSCGCSGALEARLLSPDRSGGACFWWVRGGAGWAESEGLRRGRGGPALLCSRLRRPPHTRPRQDHPGFTLRLCALCWLPG